MNANTFEPQSHSEVIIVGAGLAGATAAYYLAKAGYSVMVLDRQSFPRDKVCGDFAGPAAINELHALGITELVEFQKANIINKAAIFIDGQEQIVGDIPEFPHLKRKGRVIPRKTLDNWVLDAARKAGAQIRENTLVTSYQIEKDAVKVTVKDSTGTHFLTAALLIGADGSNSKIATALRGSPVPKADITIGVRGYFQNVEGPIDRADLHFSSKSFPGYCWLFPSGENQANVGVGVLVESIPKGNQPKELFFELINQDKGLKKRLKNATFDGKLEAWPLNTYDANLPIVGDRVMLIGEAAGLVNPINGEGIQYALLSGRWASENAQVCLKSGDFSQNALSPYAKRVEAELAVGFKVSAILIQLIRNRNLNPLWLKTFETMIERSKTDPKYANIAGGILAGLVSPTEGLTPQFLIGTIEEAALSNTIRIVGDTVEDPSTLPNTVIKIAQTGIETALNTAQNPFGFLEWTMETAAKMAELAVTVPRQMAKENIKAGSSSQ